MAARLAAEEEGGALRCEREVEGGRQEVLEVVMVERIDLARDLRQLGQVVAAAEAAES